jgi:pyridoxamine 5'-phosphate oxidase
MSIDATNLRVDYQADELLESNANPNPMLQFKQWFEAALEDNIPEPNAMVIATIDERGRPAARVVLLKETTERGFVFYTNYESRKGQELAANPNIAVAFNWLEHQQQVRIEGRVEKLSAAQSDRYFQSRPKGSQIGAWVSPQSQEIPHREFLEQKKKEIETAYADADKLPRPENWGGYLIIPDTIEFWQGRTSRLHDRLVYRREAEGQDWKIVRLAP